MNKLQYPYDEIFVLIKKNKLEERSIYTVYMYIYI